MNRIILIGNGFDLAHGLKTKYIDFINDYWEKVIDELFLKFRAEGKILFLTPKFRPQYEYENNDIIINGIPYDQSIHLQYDPSQIGFKKLLSIGYQLYDNFEERVSFKNQFLLNLTSNTLLYDWVDIEEAYYQALIDCLEGKKDNDIQKLNNDFAGIKCLLEKYLIRQSANQTENYQEIGEKMYMSLSRCDVDTFSKDNFPENLLFLNFNYTSTEEKYLARPNNTQIIHIHGELNNHANPIIFGYGDETDERYKIISNKNDNKYLENIKTFQYLETNNYTKTLSFLNSGEYQIFIMGHSCGLSDKTLLKTLFEHQNCKSIQIFYHKKSDNTDNYQDIARNISRCFTKPAVMRDVLVNKQDSKPLLTS